MNNNISCFSVRVNKGIGRLKKDADILLRMVADEDSEMGEVLGEGEIFFAKNGNNGCDLIVCYFIVVEVANIGDSKPSLSVGGL